MGRVLLWRSDPNGDRFFALQTFRRDGSAVTTPIWLSPGGAGWVGYTPGRSGKVRRIRRDPRVRVASCDADGVVRGPWWEGRARVLPADRLGAATGPLRRKYGLAFRVFRGVLLLEAVRSGRAVGFEIEAA